MRVRELVSLLLLLGVTGCVRQTRVADGTRAQVLHMGNAVEPHDLDPTTNSGDYEGRIISALFEGLVVLASDGETILPGMAESWDQSADGRVYTFHLRANAQWSNGDPVTATDFRDSFLRLYEPKLASESAEQPFVIAGSMSYFRGQTTDPASVGLRATDPHTFVLSLEQPAPYLLTLLAGYPFLPVHRATLEKFGGWLRQGTAWTRPGNMVSNGCFVLSEWKPDQEIVVKKNPRYWAADRVRLQEVHFYPFSDRSVEENAFRAGQLHLTRFIPFSRLEAYRQRHALDLHEVPWLDTHYLIFNTRAAPFNDPRVRRAFSLAINRDVLATTVYHRTSVPAHSLTFPSTGKYDPPDLIRSDPVEARRLLAEAGFPRGVGLPPLDWTLSGSTVGEMAEVLQQNWEKELGVHVQISRVEWKVYLSALAQQKFQLGALGWGYFANDPAFILQLLTGGFASNYSGWANVNYDRAYARAQSTADPKQRRRAFDEMEELLAAEMPVAPLVHYRQAFLIHPDVRGWKDNVLAQIDWRDLWLEAR